jgi:superfamily II DNA helicase RecQ
MEILKDKELLDKRNQKYITEKFDWDERALRALKEKFGLHEFRENQIGIINATMSG